MPSLTYFRVEAIYVDKAIPRENGQGTLTTKSKPIVRSPKKVGIVGFSFGLRAAQEEPNPSNFNLAQQLRKIYISLIKDEKEPIVVTQWEITKGLDELSRIYTKPEHVTVKVSKSVELIEDGTYLDSEGVWAEAKKVFAAEGVHNVIIIGQPFVHSIKLQQMVRRDGFAVVKTKLQPVPFDSSQRNTQPWTRSKSAILAYAGRSVLGKNSGHDGRQNAE